MSADLGVWMKDNGVCQILDIPSPVDQTPRQFKFLVGIEEFREVPAGVEVRLSPYRARPTQEERYGTASVGTLGSRTWNVTPLGSAALINQAQRHSSEPIVFVERAPKHLRGTRLYDCIVVQKPHDIGGCR